MVQFKKRCQNQLKHEQMVSLSGSFGWKGNQKKNSAQFCRFNFFFLASNLNWASSSPTHIDSRCAYQTMCCFFFLFFIAGGFYGKWTITKRKPTKPCKLHGIFFIHKVRYIYVAHNTTSEERERIIKRTVQKKMKAIRLK